MHFKKCGPVKNIPTFQIKIGVFIIVPFLLKCPGIHIVFVLTLHWLKYTSIYGHTALSAIGFLLFLSYMSLWPSG